MKTDPMRSAAILLGFLLIAAASCVMGKSPARVVPARIATVDNTYDVVIYGGTSAGVIAAVHVARMGRAVVLIEPGRHLGGLSSGGLGMTDSGNRTVIGGLSREFYQRIKKHYDRDSAWAFEARNGYRHYDPNADAIWRFEPHVAEKVFNDMIREAKVPVVFGERLEARRRRGDEFLVADAGMQKLFEYSL